MRTTYALTVVATALAVTGGLVAPAGAEDAHHGQRAAAVTATTPDPYLALLPGGSRPDYAAWRTRLGAAADARAGSARLAAARQQAVGVPTTGSYAEREPAGSAGGNDTLPTAERVTALGTGAGQDSRVDVSGRLSDQPPPTTRPLAPVAEDNGSITLAGATGVDGPGGVTTTGTLGDGPHGSAGDGTNDFDVYGLRATAGTDLVADTSATTAATDTVLLVYDATGTLLATDDDGGTTPGHSRVSVPVTTTGDYFVVVAGYAVGGSAPRDAFDSGSGTGGAKEGPYSLVVSDTQADRDFYSVRLRAGDVFGGTASGTVDTVEVYGPDGRAAIAGTFMDLSALYPPTSPLPGGGTTTFAFVADKPGWYRVQVLGGLGAYGVDLETYRPGPESASPQRVQTVYLDFAPGRVNTAMFGGRGVTDLSPFRDFISRWGLSPSREGELIRRITAVVREDLVSDQQVAALNPSFRLQVSNSRYGEDRWGQPGVSRVLVGGTMEQAGVETIGISQDVDPGNFATEDQSLVLLDALSDPNTSDQSSVNAYLGAGSDRLAFVAQVVGNVIAHEVGHLVGGFHTDPTDGVGNLLDAGGDYAGLYGVGPDHLGGTADDVDVDFTTDAYDPVEGFTGRENCLNLTSWAASYR